LDSVRCSDVTAAWSGSEVAVQEVYGWGSAATAARCGCKGFLCGRSLACTAFPAALLLQHGQGVTHSSAVQVVCGFKPLASWEVGPVLQ
jgi:hypothetical protein